MSKTSFTNHSWKAIVTEREGKDKKSDSQETAYKFSGGRELKNGTPYAWTASR